MKRSFYAIAITLLMSIFVIVTFNTQPIKADPTAKVYIDPPSQIVAVGDSFTVDVIIANVSNLYGFDFKLYYNSTVMNGTVVAEGEFLALGSGQIPSFDLRNFTDNYNSTCGFLHIVSALTGSASGVSGDGLFATMGFKSLVLGDSAPLSLADVRLYGPGGSSISHEDNDGTVTVVANETIHIRADGSIDPSSAPIHQERDTYTLTGNITSNANGIVIERSNMTLDGAGYTLQGTGIDVGIDLKGITNVTIKDMTVENFWINVQLDDSSNSNLVGNSIENHIGGQSYGIYLKNSENNDIFRNEISYQCWGIQLQSSDNNTFLENNFTCSQAIAFMGQLNPSITLSNNNTFYHNNFMGTWYYTNLPISLAFNEKNYWDNGYPSGGNYWYGQDSRYRYNGFDFLSGPYQNETGSDGLGDTPFVLGGEEIDHYPLMNPYIPLPGPSPPVANFTWSPVLPIANQSITFDASSSLPGWNGTNTMPIVLYSWDLGDGNKTTGQTVTHTYASLGNYTITLNVTDRQGLSDVKQKQIQVGQIHGPSAEFTAPEIAHVGDMVEFNASASLPGWNGTNDTPITGYLWGFGDGNITSTSASLIAHNYTSPGTLNVTLTVFDTEGLNSSLSKTILVIMPTSILVSTRSTSTVVGFVVGINGTLRDAYGNGLEKETVVLYYTFPGVNLWFPISSGITDHLGNYYVQWIPTATGYFTIEAEWAGNATHSGTSGNTTLSSLAYNNQYVFSVESNSTISELAFNMTDWSLSFTATGSSGTRGYTKVTIAKSLAANPANIAVYLDDNKTDYTITSTDDSWLLTLNYTHSTHQVLVDLNTEVIPEFPIMMILPLLMLATLPAILIYKRKHSQNAN